MGKAVGMTSYDIVDRKAALALTHFTIEQVQEFWPQLEETLDRVPHTWRHWTKEYIYGGILSGNI